MKKTLMPGLILALGLAAAMPAAADTIPAAAGSFDGPAWEHGTVLAGIQAGMPAGTTFSKVGDAGDQFWILTGASASVSVPFTFSAWHQDFGYFDGSNSFVGVIHSFSNGFGPATWIYPPQTTASSANFAPGNSPFTLANRPTEAIHDLDPSAQAVHLWSSDASANGGEDHLVTYQVLLNGIATGQYLLAWEDAPLGSADRDYQDQILLVSGIRPVPEPGTLALLGTGVMGLIGYARRRKA